jgi:KaiC/GvpD/RAD55 family RecA-like ATPase
MRVLKLDIPGLDLVLEGGVRLLERMKGAGESATILIRGPAGSGKTVLGTQLAASIARALQTDVAYGCIELLPVELQAQHESIRSREAQEQVVILVENEQQPDPSHVRIYASLLALGEEPKQIVSQLGEAVEVLLEVANTRAQRKVRVLVIDSLSDGYGLGSQAPRLLADGICKFAAEQGLVLVLLEETTGDQPSVWSFSVDTVFELRAVSSGRLSERKLTIPKNRLGSADLGPHAFEFIAQYGIRFYPGVTAYKKEWLIRHLVNATQIPALQQSWGLPELNSISWLPSFRSCVTAVVGQDSSLVRKLALQVGSKREGNQESLGDEFQIWLGKAAPSVLLDEHADEMTGIAETVMAVWSLSASAEQLLADFRLLVEQHLKSHAIPHRVVLGDLRDLQYHVDPKGMLFSIEIVASIFLSLKIPLVLVETIDEHNEGSASMALAQVGIRCFARPDNQTVDIIVEDIMNSKSKSLELPLS